MTSKTTKAKAKTTGRPKGAKTQERPVVDLTPTACPHCGAATKPVNLRNPRTIKGEGQLTDGRRYTSVTLRSADCGNCGAAVTVRSHEFLPS